jgi:hypothetical protein
MLLQREINIECMCSNRYLDFFQKPYPIGYLCCMGDVVYVFLQTALYYWICQMLHKIKPFSKLLTSILSTVKAGLQSCCDTSSTSEVMWIRYGFWKKSKYLLEHMHSIFISLCNNIDTFDLYVNNLENGFILWSIWQIQ